MTKSYKQIANELHDARAAVLVALSDAKVELHVDDYVEIEKFDQAVDQMLELMQYIATLSEEDNDNE